MASSKESLESTEVVEDVATKSVCTEIISCVMEKDNNLMRQPLEGLKCKAKTNSSGEAVTGLQGDMIMTSRDDHFLLAL